MRRLAFLALGVALGALAVSGQDGGDALAQEIDRLRALLEERIAKAPPRGEHQVVRRTYDVADICTKVEDRPQPFDDLRPSKYQGPEPEPPPEPYAPFEVDGLIEMIRRGVEPASWDVVEGTGIEPRNGRLFVYTSPRVHGKIERLLAWCRAAADRRVSVEVAVVPVRDGPLPPELTDEEAKRLLAGPLGSVELAGFDAHVLGGRAGREITYLRDFDVKVVEGAAIGDPVLGTIFSGTTAQVLVGLDDAGGAVVHCRLNLSRVQEPIPAHATPHGNLELPTVGITRVLASFWAPLDRTVVAGACTVGDEPCAVLVTVRRR